MDNSFLGIRIANSDRHAFSYATPDSHADNPVPFCSAAIANAGSDAEYINIELDSY
jgi:hypothetical protein